MNRQATAERALDPAEAYFYQMDRITPLHIVMLVERASPWPEAAVRAALAHLQRTDVLLQKTIGLQEDGSLGFVDAPGRPIPFTAVSTDTDAWTASVEDALAHRFDAVQAPLLRCAQLHARANGRACLVVALHHAIGDGRSAGAIARRMVEHMAWQAGARGAAGVPDTPSQPPPMHSVFPPAFRWAEQAGALRKAASALLRDVASAGLPNTLPWFRPAPSGKLPRYLRLQFDGAVLQRLRAQMRERNVSLYGVLCAAQLLSQYRLLGVADTARLFLTTPIDMRQHVDGTPDIAPTQLYASMVYATYQVGPASTLWELARDVMARTRMQIARGDGHYFYHASDVAAALKAPDNLAGFANMLDKVPRGSVMSVLGAMPELDCDPLVESMTFALCSARHHALFSVAHTFRGRLAIDVCYDEANLEEGAGPALVAGMGAALEAAAR